MEQNIGTALSVMIVGMATVFLILWLVVIIGNVTIRLTNKFSNSIETDKKEKKSVSDSSSKIAAIVAAVDLVTIGKGHITKITKV